MINLLIAIKVQPLFCITTFQYETVCQLWSEAVLSATLLEIDGNELRTTQQPVFFSCTFHTSLSARKLKWDTPGVFFLYTNFFSFQFLPSLFIWPLFKLNIKKETTTKMPYHWIWSYKMFAFAWNYSSYLAYILEHWLFMAIVHVCFVFWKWICNVKIYYWILKDLHFGR